MVVGASGQGESPYQTMAKQYEQATGVHIDVTLLPPDSYDQTVRTQLQAGTAADLIGVTPGSSLPTSVMPLVNAGFLDPITNPSAKQAILAGSEHLFSKDGKIYAEPTGITAFGLIHNDAAAQGAGITFPATWQDLLADCAKTGGDPAFTAIGGSVANANSVLGMALAGGLVYANDPDWNAKRTAHSVSFANSPEWKAVLQAVVDMNKAQCFQPGAAGGTFDQMMGDLMQGKALSVALPSAAIADLQGANPALKLSVQAVPPTGSADRFLIAGQNYAFGVNANAEASHKTAAAAFLDWLAQPANNAQVARAEGSIPLADVSNKSSIPDSYAPVADLLSSGKYSYLPSCDWPNAAVYDALGVGIQSLLTGQGTVDSVLESMDRAWGQ